VRGEGDEREVFVGNREARKSATLFVNEEEGVGGRVGGPLRREEEEDFHGHFSLSNVFQGSESQLNISLFASNG